MSSVKGAAFREFLLWYDEEHGHGRVVDAVQRLPERWRAELDPASTSFGVLPSVWYPAPLVHALLDALLVDLSRTDAQKLAQAGARATLSATMRGLHAVLFRLVASPERYARHAHRLWSANYSSGRLEVDIVGRDKALSRVVDWDGHHWFICDMNSEARLLIYEAMGCKNPVGRRLTCVSRGDADCSFEVTWT